jgi:hypothetical protein
MLVFYGNGFDEIHNAKIEEKPYATNKIHKANRSCAGSESLAPPTVSFLIRSCHQHGSTLNMKALTVAALAALVVGSLLSIAPTSARFRGCKSPNPPSECSSSRFPGGSVTGSISRASSDKTSRVKPGTAANK